MKLPAVRPACTPPGRFRPAVQRRAACRAFRAASFSSLIALRPPRGSSVQPGRPSRMSFRLRHVGGGKPRGLGGRFPERVQKVRKMHKAGKVRSRGDDLKIPSSPSLAFLDAAAGWRA